MSKLQPILLDQTGQQINQTLQQIHQTLAANAAALDDTKTTTFSTWSSNKIVNALASAATISDSTTSTFTPIAATPLHILTTIEEAGPISLVLSNGATSQYFAATIDQAGTYNWTEATLQLSDGSIIQTNNTLYAIYALPDTNTLKTDGGTSTITYNTIAAASSSYDFIFGGNATDN